MSEEWAKDIPKHSILEYSSTPQRPEQKQYDSGNISSTSSNSTPNISNIQSATLGPDDTLNSSLLRGHRTKLSPHDIRLILYLICTIKPFKYIGDRSLSQTKKWEQIQERYGNDKREELHDSGHQLVIPTVRTLQRQLSTAIKKATLKRKEDRRQGKLPLEFGTDSTSFEEEEERIDRVISRHSSLVELENALLDLNDLSEWFRLGKSQSGNQLKTRKDNSNTSSPKQETDVNMTEESRPYNGLEGGIAAAAILRASASVDSSTRRPVAHVRSELESVLPKNARTSKLLKTVDDLASILEESSRTQEALRSENSAIIEETERLIKAQQSYTKKVKEFNQKHERSVRELRRTIVNGVVDSFELETSEVESGDLESLLASLKDSLY